MRDRDAKGAQARKKSIEGGAALGDCVRVCAVGSSQRSPHGIKGADPLLFLEIAEQFELAGAPLR